jgi:hypothetical protein
MTTQEQRTEEAQPSAGLPTPLRERSRTPAAAETTSRGGRCRDAQGSVRTPLDMTVHAIRRRGG